MTAQQFLPASVNGLINNLAPLWLSIFAAMMGTAVRPVMLVTGSALAAVGVAIVLLGDTLLASFTGGSGATMPDADATTWIGVAISITGSVLICYQNYLARKVVQGLDPVAITALGSACGSLIVGLVLATGTGGTLSGFGTVSVPTALVLVWLGTVSTAFNFTLWTYALSQLPVARIVNLQYLVPPLGVVVSVVFLGEPVGPGLVVGAAAILVGIILAQRGTAMARA
jgi:drug/metabolite transporter (DMT)-like permease